MRDFIVTEMGFRGKRIRAAAMLEDGRIDELRVENASSASFVSRIYRGTVDSVSRNIHGAFVDIGGMKAFLPLSKSESVHASGPILVQVTKDASGVKAPVVTTNLHLSGRFAVVSRVPGPLSFSAKLTEEQKGIISAWVRDCGTGRYRILVRTNAAKAQKMQVLDEIRDLSERMDRILEEYKEASSGECLYSPDPFYVTMLRDAYVKPDRIFTDIPAYAEILGDFDIRQEEEILYVQGNRTLTLAGLYSLDSRLEKLAGKHVYLKSGAYIVIERTEAFVSIDVNTGKCTRGRIPEETYRRINLEAAEEIARELRVRNLSGMILVDFISLESEDHKSELVNVMKKLVKKDHIHTEVVDLTPLGIMEIVRQKVRKPLEEELGLC